jgi:nicotinamidase/pyrazinamidase
MSTEIMLAELTPRAGDALLVIDMQQDFLPGGALPVEGGDQLVALINAYLHAFADRGLPIFASRDWHPADHMSFKRQGGPWPSHCVVGSTGAQWAPGLAWPASTQVISKGCDREGDAYSAFFETDLAERLQHAGVHRVFVAGLATDYCVLRTVQDARLLGLGVVLLLDAVAAVDVQAGDGQRAVHQMHGWGVEAACFAELFESST